MKFQINRDANRKVVAKVLDNEYLIFKISNKEGYVVEFHPNGEVLVLTDCGSYEEDPVEYVYEGDSITIST